MKFSIRKVGCGKLKILGESIGGIMATLK